MYWGRAKVGGIGGGGAVPAHLDEDLPTVRLPDVVAHPLEAVQRLPHEVFVAPVGGDVPQPRAKGRAAEGQCSGSVGGGGRRAGSTTNTNAQR